MSRKNQRRERHRVEREVEEAWQALEDGEPALALRLARRAREAGAVNPRVLLDCGRILLAGAATDEAEAALRESIRLAPNYADAFAALAELQANSHKMTAAIRLQAKVVELEPGNELARRRLGEWQTAAGADAANQEEPAAPRPDAAPAVATEFAHRLGTLDAAALTAALVRQGSCVVPALLTGRERAQLAGAWESDSGTSQEFVVPYEQRRTHYRWFLEPLPELLARLRAALWGTAVELASRQQAMLGRTASFPGAVADWLAAARHRGTREESIRILRLEPGAVTPAARVELRTAFPLRVVVDLGGDGSPAPGAGDATLELTDQRPGRRVRSHRTATAPGDAVLFCCRDRLDRVGSAFGLQPVTFAFGPFAGRRTLVDLAFAGDGSP